MANSLENILHYRVIGDGHPVVFLHGFMLSSTLWKNLSVNIPKGIQGIFIDLPGHGASNTIECPDNIDDIASLVHETIKSVTVKPFSIVGHSMGGYIALELLKKRVPIKKCVLLNSNFWEDSAEKKKERNRIAKVVKLNAQYLIQEAIPHLFPPSTKNNFEAEIKDYIDVALQMNPQNILNATIAMRDRPDLSSVMRKNPSKFFIIQGVLDHIIPNELMEYYLKKYHLENVLLYQNNSGHMSIIEKEQEVEKIVFDFLT